MKTKTVVPIFFLTEVFGVKYFFSPSVFTLSPKVLRLRVGDVVHVWVATPPHTPSLSELQCFKGCVRQIVSEELCGSQSVYHIFSILKCGWVM